MSSDPIDKMVADGIPNNRGFQGDLSLGLASHIRKLLNDQSLPYPSKIFAGSFLALYYPRGYLSPKRYPFDKRSAEWTFTSNDNRNFQCFVLPRDSEQLKPYLQ